MAPPALPLAPFIDLCPGFRPQACAAIRARAVPFVEGHATRAVALGWTAEELFGVHPVLGSVRVHCCGALMLSNAGQVASVEPEAIRYANGLISRRASVTNL